MAQYPKEPFAEQKPTNRVVFGLCCACGKKFHSDSINKDQNIPLLEHDRNTIRKWAKVGEMGENSEVLENPAEKMVRNHPWNGGKWWFQCVMGCRGWV